MAHKLTRLHVLLFILTFMTTLFAGAMLAGVIPWQNPEKIYLGLPFSITLLLILLTHEMSHYFMSRKHHVSVTLPYFIPAPSIIGTFGAIIKMRPPIPDRRSLIDIGAAGPLGGFIVAVVAVMIGLTYSDIKSAKEIQEGLSLGSSILFYILSKIVLNVDPDKYEIVLHPIAFAGWIGFLVTSLNLLPIGQLDGGHIIYALLGEKHQRVSKWIIPILIVLGILFWSGWIIWAFLMLILGYKHPPVVYPEIPLDGKRKLIGWICFVIFILTFTAVPIKGV
ncbi:MAG: site-2 protease family protein [Thermodesulfovibrionia bacterium]|nr:site-2 protease family protein [Thermodesulfovibrionia bacterium]